MSRLFQNMTKLFYTWYYKSASKILEFNWWALDHISFVWNNCLVWWLHRDNFCNLSMISSRIYGQLLHLRSLELWSRFLVLKSLVIFLNSRLRLPIPSHYFIINMRRGPVFRWRSRRQDANDHAHLMLKISPTKLLVLCNSPNYAVSFCNQSNMMHLPFDFQL